MSELKLTYFDFSGSRGEECRLALYLAGADFEDHRIKRPEWLELKPKTPFGSLPVLDVSGKPMLAQSNVILAYVGRRFGLHPDDQWEAARHESVMAAVEDLRNAVPGGGVEDPAEKQRLREEFASGYMQRWGANVERQIKGPFVGGESLFVADIKVFNIVQSFVSGVIDHVPSDVFEAFVKLTALHRAVGAHPKIAEWRAKHAQ